MAATVHTVDSHAIRVQCLKALTTLAPADFAQFYRVVSNAGQPRVSDLLVEPMSCTRDFAANTVTIRMRSDVLGPWLKGLSWAGPARPPSKLERSNFLEDAACFTPEQWERSVARQVLAKAVGFRSQLRLLAYQGTVHTGWIGLVRCGNTKPFTARDREVMRAHVPRVQALLATAARIDDGRFGRLEPADVILTGAGELLHASAWAGEWLAESPGLRPYLAQAARALDQQRATDAAYAFDGMVIRFCRLDGDSGVLYLAHLSPSSAWELGPLARLTPRQRRLAILLASGHTVRAAASVMGISAGTAAVHARNIHAVLNVHSRAQLAAVVMQRHAAGDGVP